MIKPLVWVFLLLFGALMTADARKRKLRLIGAVLVLFVFTNPFLVNEICMAYEDRGSPVLDSAYEAGIVLGGFSREDTSLKRTVFYDASDRLMQALTAYRKGQIRKILISGGSSAILNREQKEADAVRAWLLDLGIPDSAILTENRSRNTLENIEYSQKLLDSLGIQSKVLIFTSAWHIPRVQLCLNNRMDADFFATHFMSDRKRDFSPESLLLPSVKALSNAELLMKEWIGYVFYMLKAS